MIYRRREELTVVELQEDEEQISFSRLQEIIFDIPSNVIYCERDGKLYGIVTMGDILRASGNGADCVTVNICYTNLRAGEEMRARKIFSEKTSINVLPVLGENGILLGDWLRWNDLALNKYIFIEGQQSAYYDKGAYIALVRPCGVFKAKQESFEICCEKLEALGGKIEHIAYDEISEYAEKVDWILFVDEDERRALDTLYRYIWHRRDVGEKIKTYRWYIKNVVNQVNKVLISSYFSDIKEKGIAIFNMVYEQDEYYWLMKKEIQKKFSYIGEEPCNVLFPSMYKEFYGDLYTQEDINELHADLGKMSVESGSGKLRDYKSRFYNVTNGERHTKEQPQNYKKVVYFVGPCLVYGIHTEDKNTIESFLQERINKAAYEVKVINYGSPSHSNISMQFASILNMPLRRGDIIILYVDDESIKNIPEINLMDALKRHDINSGWMVDDVRHCNEKINNLYADIIFQKIRPLLSESVERQGEHVILSVDAVKKIYIDRYFWNFDISAYNKIGSIVMNCNPFTYGHRYLIEQALKIVDFLIIFVVEEDKSFFSFNERFLMVCEGVTDLKNVKIVPSGPFILSQTTFPEYFIKTADENLAENTKNDISIFAEKIAPHLNIRYRFVGEEPEDVVTNEYNITMKRILPKKGIELIEVPRKKMNEKYISASAVRKCLKDNNMSGFRKLVPKSTVQVLFG